jgi:hypothetical protein
VKHLALCALLALMAVCGGSLPATATAAPPANDSFLSAQSLGSGLPVKVTATNLEATKEVGEPSPGGLGFANTGHSIWFEWEATATGFVTVGTCRSNVRATIGVYTGTTIGTLTEVAGDFSSEGPDCSTFYGRAITFRAIAGVKYTIFIDGIASFPEEGSMAGQGTIELDVDVTPTPLNDDFASATVLNEQVLWNGVYSAGASGFSWNATKEPGEPLHAGGPGGASVWYAWTAPSSDDYVLGVCARYEALFGFYTGNSVDSLSNVASPRAGCGQIIFTANVGTTYRIAVDGAFDSGSGAADAGSSQVHIFRSPPSPVFTDGGVGVAEPRRRIRKVNTSIAKRIVKPVQGRATFVFRSNSPRSNFKCRLDGHPFAACRSPRTYQNLEPGRHTFKVMAVDVASNADSSPAVARFRIAEPAPHRAG